MNKVFLLVGLGFTVLIACMVSCDKSLVSLPQADSVLDAPLEGLTSQQNKIFLDGAAEFDEVYNSATGLGPIFVSNSCASCHAGDSRGHFSTILTRFGQTDSSGNMFLDKGGPQLQNHSIPNFFPEQIPAGATSSRFIAPIVSGTGFLDLVSDADILAMSDPNDANGDGISGVPNWNTIPSYITPLASAITQNGKYICRFGRKAPVYNLHQQTVNALNEDMGITSSFSPRNPSNYLQGTNPVSINDPEISDKSLNALVFYLQTLQTPYQRNAENPSVDQGKNLFIQIGCENCHKQTLKTGNSGVEALSNKIFHPYTDLLLHDMGNELNDGYTEGSAKPSEWRTQPLWGLGLAADAQGGNYFLMHDGRAKSIEEATLLHGGESTKSRDNYKNLKESEKQALLTFLKSL